MAEALEEIATGVEVEEQRKVAIQILHVRRRYQKSGVPGCFLLKILDKSKVFARPQE